MAKTIRGVQDERLCVFFFFQAEDGIRDLTVAGVQTCALPISKANQKRVSRGSVRWSRRLSPGRISRRTCVSIAPLSAITEVNVMLFTRAGSSLDRKSVV